MMIAASIYSLDTGAIRMTGSFPNMATIEANVADGEWWVEGEWAPNLYAVREGQVVPRLLPYDTALRPRRDRMLLESDWTQLPDAPLSDEQKTVWREYRQALRDLPETGGEWPAPPQG